MRILLLCLLQLIIIQPAVSASSVVEVVGGVPITVPAPPGFVDPSSVSKDLRSIGETMTPPTNRLLALFISEPDIKRIASGKSATLSRYFMAQTMRKIESTNVSVRDFVKLREMFKQQQRDLLERNKNKIQQNIDSASKEIGRQFQDPTLTVKVGEILPLGVFHEGDSSIGMAALVKYSFVINGKTEERPMAMAMTFALVKGRIIFLYAYSSYRSNADAEWARSVSLQWVSSLASLN